MEINCLALIWFTMEGLTLKVNVCLGIEDLKLLVLDFQCFSKLKSLGLSNNISVNKADSILLTL